ncbi:PepSY domain-containing protein [Rhizobium sp. GN54]|uniref:PepSY domain-containing protein n=1 Tax=Rhizobium sp. GN54 TaxID=2898150 RepID=UPI001E2A5B2E|nr:PepSY domain-containing protein [Rhizobium sp. GN54]MCD2183846.1 PepSY domain-containing protein [Rhizobium sp. GN54]
MNRIIVATVLAVTSASMAHADDDDRRCPNVQLNKWMSEGQLQARVAELGVAVREIEIDDGCYEIKGHNRDGRHIEVRLHPETGEQLFVDGDD